MLLLFNGLPLFDTFRVCPNNFNVVQILTVSEKEVLEWIYKMKIENESQVDTSCNR